MFFVKELERILTMHPSFQGTNIRNYLVDDVQKKVEGVVQDGYYVICVMDDIQFSEGKVLPSGGLVEFTAHYRALCYKPFRNEVVSGGVLVQV
jgi:DNA-directed RNA polymerase II subunit RPB7